MTSPTQVKCQIARFVVRLRRQRLRPQLYISYVIYFYLHISFVGLLVELANAHRASFVASPSWSWTFNSFCFKKILIEISALLFLLFQTTMLAAAIWITTLLRCNAATRDSLLVSTNWEARPDFCHDLNCPLFSVEKLGYGWELRNYEAGMQYSI